MIVHDGSDFNMFSPAIAFAPYKPPAANYALEAVMQANSLSLNGDVGFGITARATGPVSRYDSPAYLGGWNGQDRVGIGAGGDYRFDLARSPFKIDGQFHTWRLEARGNQYRLLVDGTLVAEALDNRYLDGRQVGVWSVHYQVTVCWFAVRALD